MKKCHVPSTFFTHVFAMLARAVKGFSTSSSAEQLETPRRFEKKRRGVLVMHYIMFTKPPTSGVM
jgi:hypothetical protein